MSQTEFKTWYDDNTLICAVLESTDESFDHEFGREVVQGESVEDLRVIVYIGGFDYDVTTALPDSFIENLKEWVLERRQL